MSRHTKFEDNSETPLGELGTHAFFPLGNNVGKTKMEIDYYDEAT